MDLARPLFYSLRYCRAMLETPVPDAVFNTLKAQPRASPSALKVMLMDFLFLRALRPYHTTTSDAWTPLARFALYLRGHWLRMPPWLLVIHLARKLFARDKPNHGETRERGMSNDRTAVAGVFNREVEHN
jgi:hypothetical protein